jgi:hypothetical protein
VAFISSPNPTAHPALCVKLIPPPSNVFFCFSIQAKKVFSETLPRREARKASGALRKKAFGALQNFTWGALSAIL